MKITNPEVDQFIEKTDKWQPELAALRRILLKSNLTESFKWKQPCYTFEDHNIAIIGSLKDCCVLSFFKGALLKDPNEILEKPGSNTQSARLIRFTSVQQITDLEAIINAYVQEALANEKAGKKVAFKKTEEIDFPEELGMFFQQNALLKKAFETLTPGRQRAYVLYFTSAKQSKTRISRIEKCIPSILNGKGLGE